MSIRRIDWTILALFVVALSLTIAAPSIPSWVRYLGQVAVGIALASAGVMIMLRAGLLTFGQGLFYFVGGYAVALMNRHAATSDAVVLVFVAVLSSGLVATILGPFMARYRGIFFSMLTLAVSMVIFGIATKLRIFGGSDGLNVGLMSYFGYSPRGPQAQMAGFIFCIWVWTVIAVATHILLRSRFGKVIQAVSDNEIRVEYLGYSVRRVIWLAYIVAGMLGGAGGALAGISARHVDPQFAYWTTAGDFIFVTLLSGQASILSPFFGSFALELMRSYASAIFPDQWQAVFGAMMLAIVLFIPLGLDRLIILSWRLALQLFRSRSGTVQQTEVVP